MERLSFVKNWNGKLFDEVIYFTTIRLYNLSKYYVGNTFEVYLKEDQIGHAKVVNVRTLMLHEVNDFISGIDAGFSVDEFKALMKKFYPKADWTTQKLQFILLKKYEHP